MAGSKKQVSVDAMGLYQWIANDLQRLRNELLKEMRYSSVQVGSLYQEIKADKETSTSAISQEIRYSYKQNQTIYDGLATMLTQEVGDRLNSVDEKLSALSEIQTLLDEIREVKYSYMQLQSIYEGLTALITEDVVSKLGSIDDKVSLLEQIDATLATIATEQETLAAAINEKTEETVASYSQKILDAVAAVPVAENVDYDRITDEVGDKLMDILSEIKNEQGAPVQESCEAKIDYDRIIYGAAEKVVESLPYPEKVDYSRIDESIAKAVSAIVIPEIDYEKLAEVVAAKVVVPEIDYDKLADVVVQKMTASTQQTYDVVLDEEGLAKIAEKVAERFNPEIEAIDYTRIEEIVGSTEATVSEKLDSLSEKLDAADEEEVTYDFVIDEAGIDAIAKGVSEEICKACSACELANVEEPVVEEVVEEVTEEIVEEPVEEVVEETVEEVAEEPVVEEPVVEELAVAEAAPVQEESVNMEELNDQLIDAETGLVIRLKKSFTAKMKQSEENVKGYYSDIKNELTSYKKINSNVSWHGDRFNFGRNTVAKMNICGKTLCFYLALDPNDPEYKTTVYHQKDVGNQKAYESTPFMVKVKSDAAAKKALRLVGYLAEKLGTEKNDNFETVDYVAEFGYESTKKLFDDGFIKATKEKKVELDF